MYKYIVIETATYKQKSTHIQEMTSVKPFKRENQLSNLNKK